MTIQPRRQVGGYEVIEHIGTGGMGEVYHARDPVLRRDVALKFLLPQLATDHERLDRFRREAQALAALNHPNIAQIFALEQSDDGCCIVMELVHGATLGDRIRRGPLPVAEALRIARDMAAALEAAHSKGVIHRDLKPANVKITADGQVKVLDFGLAKVGEPNSGDLNVSHSPTLTALSRPHVILGTPRYMSPEQAKGASVDQRTDVFSFGSVLYEMLTGHPAFPGETSADAIASVVARDPDLAKLPPRLNPRIRDLLRRCLNKDLRQRWQAIGDVRIEIESILAAPEGLLERPSSEKRSPLSLLAAVALTAIAASAATAAIMWNTRSRDVAEHSSAPTRRFSIDLGEVRAVISPDGRHIAYRSADRLWVRDLDSETPREIPGGKAAGGYYSDIGYYLAWAPDSQSIAFTAENELRRVSVLQGSSATTICTLPAGRPSGRQVGGLTWSADGEEIVFSRYDNGLYAVPARGGSPTLLWKEDHADDIFLLDTPRGRAAVYAVLSTKPGHTLIVRTPNGERREVTQLDTNWPELLYSPSGHVLFRKNPTENPSIWALPLSPTTLEAQGEPFLVERSGQGMSLSGDGTLVYLDTGRSRKQFLAWRDRHGNISGGAKEGHEIIDVARLSPDGRRAIVIATDNGRSAMWTYDLEHFARTRFVVGDEARDKLILFAFWSRLGDELVYSVRSDMPDEGTRIFIRRLDTVGPAKQVPFPKGFTVVQDRSADGRYIIGSYSSRPGEPGRIWYLRNGTNGTSEPVDFSQNSETETTGILSPNERYVAYNSTIGGRSEVYVRPFPDGPGRWQISSGGGSAARWAPDGTELFFYEGNTLMRAGVSTGSKFSVSLPPTPLFEHPLLRGVAAPFARYDISPEGRRFLTVESERELARPLVRVVENWQTISTAPEARSASTR